MGMKGKGVGGAGNERAAVPSGHHGAWSSQHSEGRVLPRACERECWGACDTWASGAGQPARQGPVGADTRWGLSEVSRLPSGPAPAALMTLNLARRQGTLKEQATGLEPRRLPGDSRHQTPGHWSLLPCVSPLAVCLPCRTLTSHPPGMPGSPLEVPNWP